MLDRLTNAQLQHNRWALDRLLRRSSDLDSDRFQRRFDIGPGSLQATLAHIIEAMFYFADIFADREYVKRDRFDELAEAPTGLVDLLSRADDELREAVRHFFSSRTMEDTVNWQHPPRPVPADVALTQVFDHGTHHRAQCLNMLRQLGALGDLEIHPLLWAGADHNDQPDADTGD